MSSSVYNYLDDYGTQKFINIIMQVIEENMLTTFTDDMRHPDDDHIPTSSTALEFVNDSIDPAIQETNDKISEVREVISRLSDRVTLNMIRSEAMSDVLTHLSTQFVMGPINQITKPKETILYFQHDNINDKSWAMYIYTQGEWKIIGETKLDLVNYWSDNETDELAGRFYEHSMQPMTEEEIRGKTEEIFNVIIGIMHQVEENMISTFTEHIHEGDIEHAPTSRAVLRAVAKIDEKIDDTNEDIDKVNEILTDISKSLHIDLESFATITGPIEDVEDPNSLTLYVQHDSEENPVYTLYVYNNNEWIPLITPKKDLIKLWSKEDTDELANNFYEKTMEKMPAETIKGKTGEIFELIVDIMHQVEENMISTFSETIEDTDEQAPTSRAALKLVDRIDEKISDSNNELEHISEVLQNMVNDIPADITSAAIVTGDISTVEDPDSQTLYFQQNDNNKYTLYLYNGEWIQVGNPESELEKCWSKDDTDELIERFYNHSMQPMEEETIQNKANEIYTNTVK